MSEEVTLKNSLGEHLPGDVSPEAFAERLDDELQELLSRPSSDNTMAYRRWFKLSFPPILRRELAAADTEQAIVETHRDFRYAMASRPPEDDEIVRRTDAARVLRTILLHHASWAIRDPEQYSPESIPDQGELHLSTDGGELLQWKSLTRAVIWILSTVTSFTGTTHLAGWLLTPFLLEIPLLEPWRWHLRMALALVLAAAISHVVLMVKREVEYRMLQGVSTDDSNAFGQLSAGKAALHALRRDRHNRPRRLILLPVVALAIGVLIADAATNITGVFTFFGSYRDHTNQIEERRAEVNGRLDALRAELDVLPEAMAAQADEQVERLLAEEEGGLAVTQETGRGLMYWSKAYLLQEDAEAAAKLDTLRPDAGNCSVFHRSVTEQIGGSGLVNSAGLTEEIRQLTQQKTEAIRGSLQAIEDRMDTLSAGEAIETLQRELDTTNALFVAAVAQLNTELPRELTAYQARYDAELAGLADEARDSGCFPKATTAAMAGLQFEPVDIDTSPIEISPMAFRSPLELSAVVWELPLVQALGIFVLALFSGFFLSHLDALFLPRTSRLYTRDYRAIRAAEENINGWLMCSAEVLTAVLNRGPCSGFFKDKFHTVEQAQAFNALYHETVTPEPIKGRQTSWGMLRDWLLNTDTELIREHNRRVEFIHALYATPGRLQPVLESLLPGLDKLDHSGTFAPGMHRHYPDRRWIKRTIHRSLNDRHHSIESVQLQSIEQSLGELEAALQSDWLELLDDLASSNDQNRSGQVAIEELEEALHALSVQSPQGIEYRHSLKQRMEAVRRLLNERQMRLDAEDTAEEQVLTARV